MNTLFKMIGPQMFSHPKKGSKYISINFDLEHLRTKKIMNYTGYVWSDIKFQIGLNYLRSCTGMTIIHDSDFLAVSDYIDFLLNNKHEVVFVLRPTEDYRKSDSPLSPKIATASNKRIRMAYDRLKKAGVKVKKFKSMKALEKYLDKKVS